MHCEPGRLRGDLVQRRGGVSMSSGRSHHRWLPRWHEIGRNPGNEHELTKIWPMRLRRRGALPTKEPIAVRRNKTPCPTAGQPRASSPAASRSPLSRYRREKGGVWEVSSASNRERFGRLIAGTIFSFRATPADRGVHVENFRRCSITGRLDAVKETKLSQVPANLGASSLRRELLYPAQSGAGQCCRTLCPARGASGPRPSRPGSSLFSFFSLFYFFCFYFTLYFEQIF
jgi:hypothetical protein